MKYMVYIEKSNTINKIGIWFTQGDKNYTEMIKKNYQAVYVQYSAGV